MTDVEREAYEQIADMIINGNGNLRQVENLIAGVYQAGYDKGWDSHRVMDKTLKETNVTTWDRQ